MDNRRKIGDVNASLQDTLAGIRVVQSFTNEEIERKKFQKSNHAFLLSKKENYHCIGSFMGWNLLFQGLMYSVKKTAESGKTFLNHFNKFYEDLDRTDENTDIKCIHGKVLPDSAVFLTSWKQNLKSKTLPTQKN